MSLRGNPKISYRKRRFVREFTPQQLRELLNPTEQRVLTLRYIERLPLAFSVIAAELGITMQGCHNAEVSALKKLRDSRA